MDRLVTAGLYTRPTHRTAAGILMDEISGKPMATEFALTRFLVPALTRYHGIAAFLDADMLVRRDVRPLFEQAAEHRDIAVWCVKHDHRPTSDQKMDGQPQTGYARKNWSSMMVFNCEHPGVRGGLTVEVVNTWRGLALHQFDWLAPTDGLIGALGVEWNWLVGHSPATVNPAIVHFTDGGPWLPGFENVAYANEWRAARDVWAGAV
jgi:hypothetical protein